MSVELFSNNAIATIVNPIGPTDTTVQINNSTFFPSPVPGSSFFAMTLTDAATKTLFEIVYCTNRVGSMLTIQRGQEGTQPLNWSAGDIVYASVTAGSLANFVQGGVIAQGTFISAPSGQNTYTYNVYNSLAVENGNNIKGTPGSMFGCSVFTDATTQTEPYWIMFIDSATMPINGAVTPLDWGRIAADSSWSWPGAANFPLPFQSGINVVLSTTGPFTLTLAAHANFSVKWL